MVKVLVSGNATHGTIREQLLSDLMSSIYKEDLKAFCDVLISPEIYFVLSPDHMVWGGGVQ